MASNSENTQGNQAYSKLLEIIYAIARGDAQKEDIAAQLRAEGYDALDLIVALLDRASAGDRNRHAQKPIDIRSFSKPTQPQVVQAIVQRVPYLPFLLDGTLYDPQDIKRFDGQELHFIASGTAAPFLAVNDKNIMARLWELSYLASIGSYSYGGYVPWGVSPSDIGSDVPTVAGQPPYGQGQGGSVPPFCSFFVDDNFQGDELDLNPNRGYMDLTQVKRGFLNLSDWNDCISSLVRGTAANVCVLYEDIDYGGQTLTFLASTPQAAQEYPAAQVGTIEVQSLRPFGFNDVASSLACW